MESVRYKRGSWQDS